MEQTVLISRRILTNLRDLLQLCKPRVTLLVVFTAATAMLLAGPPSAVQMLAALFGITAISAAAAAFNCVIERDVDWRMSRTRSRPLPSGRLTAAQAATFASALALLGLITLYQWANPLTAALGLATLLGYVVVYTLLLKPRTTQNIVIGGAAGAMPPVLGWAAATGTVTLEAFALFLVIFAWTPPHFWALALFRREDYARARLPMLPVVHGVAYTQANIVVYALLLFITSMVPFALDLAGLPYLIAALLLGSTFINKSLHLMIEYSDAKARDLFQFSIVYLFALFGAMWADLLSRLMITAM